MSAAATVAASSPYSGMTLGEAVALLGGPSWACACVGGPACCVLAVSRARELQRGAHIVVRLVEDARRLR